MVNFIIFSCWISPYWLDPISKSGEIVMNFASVIYYCNYSTQLYVIWKFHKHPLFLFASIKSIYHTVTRVIFRK